MYYKIFVSIHLITKKTCKISPVVVEVSDVTGGGNAVCDRVVGSSCYSLK